MSEIYERVARIEEKVTSSKTTLDEMRLEMKDGFKGATECLAAHTRTLSEHDRQLAELLRYNAEGEARKAASRKWAMGIIASIIVMLAGMAVTQIVEALK